MARQNLLIERSIKRKRMEAHLGLNGPPLGSQVLTPLLKCIGHRFAALQMVLFCQSIGTFLHSGGTDDGRMIHPPNFQPTHGEHGKGQAKRGGGRRSKKRSVTVAICVPFFRTNENLPSQ
jgi:hypothetical protein